VVAVVVAQLAMQVQVVQAVVLIPTTDLPVCLLHQLKELATAPTESHITEILTDMGHGVCWMVQEQLTTMDGIVIQ
jgi:hypothetical protein